MARHEAKPLWKCGECGEIHEDEDGAGECCRPMIHEMWGCPVCGEAHDKESLALRCCGPEGLTRCPCCARDYSVAEINHAAIEVAGHCNTCNPHYSVEQQIAIEDMHLERYPWNEQSLL